MKALIFLSILVFGNLALAGGVSGGGGKVIVKRDGKKIVSVQLLDLWEAENIYDRQTKIKKTSVADQVKEAFSNIKYVVHNPKPNTGIWPLENSDRATEIILQELEEIAKIFLSKDDPRIKRFRNVTLTPSDDAFEQVRPRDSEIEQMVNRFVSGPHLFHLDEDLWDAMNNTNKAATIVHEALYYLLWKNFSEANSIRVRRAVGLTVSGYQFQPFEKFIPKRHIECVSHRPRNQSESTRFYIFEGKEGTLRFVFDTVKGVPDLAFTDPNDSPDRISNLALEQVILADGKSPEMDEDVGSVNGPIDYQPRRFNFVKDIDGGGYVSHYLAADPRDGSKPKFESVYCELKR